MTTYRRYAIFWVPDGALFEQGSTWLGWDSRRGAEAQHPTIEGLASATRTPRRYGFHATLKPPFRLAPGKTLEALRDAVHALARDSAPPHLTGLKLTESGQILTLRPAAPSPALQDLGDLAVRALDAFRAPPTEEETARRLSRSLSSRQKDHLREWGYPYVMEDFRPHLTLTGALTPDDRARFGQAALDHFPPVHSPLTIETISLLGEAPDKRFHVLEDIPLTG
ncbi:MAG: DUF1045 domain-containing protein [Shimia sp.]